MSFSTFIILLSLSIGLYYGYLYYRNQYLVYSQDDTKDKCDSSQINDIKSPNFSDGSDCHVWDENGKQCRRGKYESSTKLCSSQGSIIPLVLVTVSGSLFVSAFLSLVI